MSDGHAQDGPAGGRSILARYWPLLAGGVALGMHLMVGGAYTLTLLLAPGWVSLVTALWWLVLLLVALLLLARRSPFVLAVPLVAILSWAALISAGRAWFGWA
ncbi:MAG TPA: hypothetical protein VFP72_11840 [Kineosporiaceae bacterium]|nr:hypothetical protein [Kineosporiaceae bacterium]